MALVTASQKPAWRISELRSVVGGAFFSASLALLALLFPQLSSLLWIFTGVLVFSTLLTVYMNFSRKHNSTALAEMDDQKFTANFWIRKPIKSIWGEKVDRLRNQGDLTRTVVITASTVGTNSVFMFETKEETGSSHTLYLPERLAATPEVSAFLYKLVRRLDNQVPASSKGTADKLLPYINAGRDIVEGKETVKL